MPFDPQNHFTKTVKHYATLARIPGWKPYVWHRIQEMALDCPELYAELPKAVTEKVKEPQR